jgi:hypothetical protein
MLTAMYFRIRFFFSTSKGALEFGKSSFQISHSCLIILTSRSNIHILWNNYLLIEKMFTLRISKYYGWVHNLGTSLIYSIRNSSTDVCLFSIWRDERSQELRHAYGRKTEKVYRAPNKSKKITQSTIRERT